ncbi:hypothetical protein NDA16_000287 [Ustilago loliicola]|nr:hypothetical protein NDA16_000287 [Ustilago loliicola]
MLPPHRKTPENLVMPEELDVPDQAGSQPCVAACDSATPTTSKLSQPNVDAAAHFDLVIIGAGPAALAVISRILESRPAALYTEDEHRHLHFTHRQRVPDLIPSKVAKTYIPTTNVLNIEDLEAQSRQGRKKRAKGLWNLHNSDDLCPCDGRINILVIDRLGEGFMGLWRRNFRALGISHLRSPMFFHPDASDFDALIAYANQHGKAGEGTPDQVVDLIEQRIAADKTTVAPRGRGYRRRCKGRRPTSPTDEQDERTANKRRGSDDASLPNLIEILGVVGKEKSKHKRKQQQQPKEHHSNAIVATSTKVHVNERDRRDYFTPSSSLFDSFTRRLEQKYRVQSCDDCCSSTWPGVSQYFEGDAEESLPDASASASSATKDGAKQEDSPVTTLRGRVKEMAWFDGAKSTVQDEFGNHHPGFLLELDDGTDKDSGVVISAKAVVSAIGFGGMPMIPSYLTNTSTCTQNPTFPHSSAPSSPPACGPGWMHSSCLASQSFPSPSTITTTPRERKMVVVGGGLTSAQIVVRALEHGYDKVILVTRGHLKSKPFDVDLGWVGRYSNYLKMQFWQNEDVHERLTTLRAARNGGSVTPTYAKVLARLQALGKIEIRTHTTISSALYTTTAALDRQEQQGENDVPNGEKQWSLQLRCTSDGGSISSVRADYLVVATGAKIDFGSLPFLKTLQRTHPIRLVGGMPVVTADLEYRRDVPLFVTGAYAGLQIGPAAGNLGGMRDSADRIANRLLELLSLPEAVVPKIEEQDVRVGGAEKEEEPTPKAKGKRGRKQVDAPFTHFNFDLLSIEA